MQDALNIINKDDSKKYRVHFEKTVECFLHTDYFPEGEEPCIDTEQEAWILAERFASKTKGECVNIYVVDEKWYPVPGYKEKTIKNR